MASPFIGEIRPFASSRIPRDWMACEGQILEVREHQALFSLLNDRYGGDGRKTFALPDLRGRTPVGMGHSRQDRSRLTYALGKAGGEAAGGGEPPPAGRPYQRLTYCIAIRGDYPPRAE